MQESVIEAIEAIMGSTFINLRPRSLFRQSCLTLEKQCLFCQLKGVSFLKGFICPFENCYTYKVIVGTKVKHIIVDIIDLSYSKL